MNLAQTQQLFWDLLQGERRPHDAFVGSAGLSAQERVAIYARMVLHRQVDALRETFPRVAALLGDGAFFTAAAAYVRAHPSRHPDLGQLGRKFAGFLQRPDLRELARLEWAHGEAFEAALVQSMSLEQFAELATEPEAFMLRPVRLVPSLQLLELDHDVGPLWDGAADRAPPQPARFVVWRSGFEVFHVAVDEDEACAIRLALSGAPAGEICGAFGRPERAFEALQSWLGEGWIAGS